MKPQPESVTRYVLTHVNKHGMRTLTYGQQGRWTKATREEAEELREAFLAHNSDQRLRTIYGPQAVGTFEVRACECWPGHHDPKGIYFDN